LHKIFIDQKYRKQKFGSQIIQEINKKFINKAIMLEVDSINKVAIDFYTYHHFQQINIRKDYYGKDHHALIMIKK